MGPGERTLYMEGAEKWIVTLKITRKDVRGSRLSE